MFCVYYTHVSTIHPEREIHHRSSHHHLRTHTHTHSIRARVHRDPRGSRVRHSAHWAPCTACAMCLRVHDRAPRASFLIETKVCPPCLVLRQARGPLVMCSRGAHRAYVSKTIEILRGVPPMPLAFKHAHTHTNRTSHTMENVCECVFV